jgi:hypothetical protein
LAKEGNRNPADGEKIQRGRGDKRQERLGITCCGKPNDVSSYSDFSKKGTHAK